ncbi:intramembrane metalloprotease PrsW [Fictibacillus nanhaiensis]|uniref:glutamic-type intramembrane protease PrsW n=1 Tax=Fictibacillus nanhaiensis TaxID=742169 RepID=UPI001C976DD2|nr:glutamic-type intramembrane protease PrsW [Fictibacillus nanhaiensis]MBY6035670.1 intramembrane metalloprotease PrsW [Fictibacillus nanhaiensis]
MLAVISAAVAPAIALLSFFYLKDKYETEPLSLVVKVYIFGVLLVFPVMVLQFGFKEEMNIPLFADAFLVGGALEEFLKWFLVFYGAYLHEEFNEPYDGIVYAAALSLGFASLENIFYLYTFGIEEALIRALLPVSGHALFGVIMGFYLGKAKFSSGRKKILYLNLSLILPIVLHGTFNFLLLSSTKYIFFYMFPFMIFLWWFALRKVKLANSSLNPYVNPDAKTGI